MLGTWCISVVAGVVAALAVARWVPPVDGILVQVPLWVGLAVATVVALRRARPAGLLRLRLSDVVWGVGLGLGLRTLQGMLSGSASLPFPRWGAGAIWQTPKGWMAEILAPLIVGPLVEEFAFRAVLLVAVFEMLRRSGGSMAAGVTALFVSTGAFVCLHAAFSPLTLLAGLQLFAVGAACALLVLLTGRVWGAVFLHVFYNATFLALMTVGAVLAAPGSSA